jgi:hypothetical protein
MGIRTCWNEDKLEETPKRYQNGGFSYRIFDEEGGVDA